MLGNGILNLEWECADLEWNTLHGERNSRLASSGSARLFWLLKCAQLLSKCPSHTELCKERPGTVSNLSIPSVMLFQTACSARASLA